MRRDWLGSLGLALVCAAAVVASFSTLASLAAVAGWGVSASWLLPVCLDALGMVACRVWLSPKAPGPARVFAKRIALVTVAVSIVGNAAGHLAATGHLSQGLVLVVLVGAVPPAGLAAAIHLAVLRGKSAEEVPVPDAAPVPAVKPEPSQRIVPGPAKTEPKPKPSPEKKPAAPKQPAPKPAPKPSPDKTVDEVLVHRARKIDEEHRANHNGRPIPRDDARKLLGVSNEKTGEALRLARQEEVA